MKEIKQLTIGQPPADPPIRSSDGFGRDRDTLARWWCLLNVFEWPEDFPMPKPVGWDDMKWDAQRESGKKAWEAINAAIPYPGALDYWRAVFLPQRKRQRSNNEVTSGSEPSRAAKGSGANTKI